MRIGTPQAIALSVSWVLGMLQEAANGRAVPPSCLKLAIDSVQLLLMWSLRSLEQISAPASTAVSALAKEVASFGGQLDAIGAAEDDTDVVHAIQKTQSSLFLVFSMRKLKVWLDAGNCSTRSRPCQELMPYLRRVYALHCHCA